MNRRAWISVGLGIFSIACASGALAPGESPVFTVEPLPDGGDRSVVGGFVRDGNTGRLIEGALVIVQCSCLAGQREMQTNADGLYSFRDLPPGKYTVQVLFGQANVNRSFDVAAGVRVRADFHVDPRNKFVIT